MKTFSRTLKPTARVLPVVAIAALCLVEANTQAITKSPPLGAPTAPTKMVTTPSHPPTQAQAVAEQDIRDIRPPYHIPPNWLWLAWTAGGLALAALGYGAWRGRHRLGMRVKLPYELALEELEAARRLMQPEQARAFSIAVSEVVRDYIEKSFPVRAAHRTTEEFLRDLATSPDSPLLAHQPVLADFLGHCDLAKFARWILSVPQMEAMLHSASAFILATGPSATDNSPTHSTAPTTPPSSPGVPVGAPVSLHSTLGAVSSAATTLHP
jgi:hypothetical protein